MLSELQPTNLRFDGIAVYAKAARDVSQSLEPIDSEATWRDVNGTLRAASRRLRKYRSTISGSFMLPAQLGARWPGDVVSVECAAEIVHPGKVTESGRERPAVAGSLVYEGPDGLQVPSSTPAGQVAVTRYRPVLQMRVISWQSTDQEGSASNSWSIELEEI